MEKFRSMFGGKKSLLNEDIDIDRETQKQWYPTYAMTSKGREAIKKVFNYLQPLLTRILAERELRESILKI